MFTKRTVRNRPHMLPQAAACYDRDLSRYPDHIRVSFDDGSTLVYDLRVDHPAPQLMKAIDLIHKMASEDGYIYKEDLLL